MALASQQEELEHNELEIALASKDLESVFDFGERTFLDLCHHLRCFDFLEHEAISVSAHQPLISE